MNTSHGAAYEAVSDKADVELSVRERTPSENGKKSKSSQGFFSWVKDDQTRKTSIRDAKVIPWLGIIALIVSLLTTFLSLGLLLAIQARRELVPTTGVWKMLQPASWLSAFMSLNAAALHLALGEGVTIAWWFRATRPTATMNELHSIWATGTSITNALADVRKLSYISLATIFVAILPLNAFLLQAAINTPMAQIQRWDKISVPSARELPYGFSGYFNGGDRPWGTIDPYSISGNWLGVFQQLTNTGGSKLAGYAYVGAYDQCSADGTNCTDTYQVDGSTPSNDQLLGKKYYFNDTLSTFSYKVEGTGFKIVCQNFTSDYDFVATNSTPTQSGEIFYTSLSWDYAFPNDLQLNMYWKDSPDCTGQLEARQCNLTAAVVEYPVEMKLNVANQYRGPFFSLPVNTSWHNDKVIREIPAYSDETYTNESSFEYTRYGGMALLFADWFAANVTLTTNYLENSTGNDWTIEAYSPLGNAIIPQLWNSDNGTDGCNFDVTSALSYINYFRQMTLTNPDDFDPAVEFGTFDYTDVGDPVDLVLNQIRQAMFFSSIYNGAGWWVRSYASAPDVTTFNRTGNEGDYIQQVDALRTKMVPVYKIRWYMWGVSVALTYIVILVILPTFWGFWVLSRKPTMSPIDMSRALNAPIVDNEEQHRAHVSELLKEVGHKNIHSDLQH